MGVLKGLWVWYNARVETQKDLKMKDTIREILLQSGEIAQGIPHLEMMILGIPLVIVSIAILSRGQMFRNW